MKVTVKWSKQKFKDLDLDPAVRAAPRRRRRSRMLTRAAQEPTLTFKALLFSLTQVEPERQKVRCQSCCCRTAPIATAEC